MMKKDRTSPLVKLVGFGKGQGLPNKASQSLSQNVIPTLDMSCLTGFFTDGMMSIGIKNRLNNVFASTSWAHFNCHGYYHLLFIPLFFIAHQSKCNHTPYFLT
jgi:hypothetical protein